MAAYTLSVEIPESASLVFRLLTFPKLQSRWVSNIVGHQWPDVVASGQRWTESRLGVLFLRPSLEVEVLRCDPTAFSLTTRLDDGLNVIVNQLQVNPKHNAGQHGASSSSSSIVRQTVECYTRSQQGRLLPSDKLAMMWRKHDLMLIRLRSYLQPAAGVLTVADNPAENHSLLRLRQAEGGGHAEYVPAMVVV
eukprot:gene3856-4113_t